jgi:predicted ATPase
VIRRLTLQRFKQFRGEAVDLLPSGITLLAGGNNAGKSTLLHALAVWEFCRTAIEQERGDDTFLGSSHRQGLGVGGDEFSPVAVPSLKHLWTNLKTQKESGDPDGYTLRIRCEWDNSAGRPQELEFGLALANDRLFIKVTHSNLSLGFRLPVIAYLPPFAGITDREMKVSPAIRRRRTGEGLAGAVLRNLLLDLEQKNEMQRAHLKQGRSKLTEADLRALRASDPWELLQQTLRTTFRAELVIDPFREEYHSYIRIEVVKGTVTGFKLKRYPGFNKRDLMVEGSGFLQWLSVYALATSPEVDVLLLDEPDAHLHPTLQAQMMAALEDLSRTSSKQVLVATHSSELLRHWPIGNIMEVRSRGGQKFKYLSEDHQKVGLLENLGSDYAPRIDPIRRAGRMLFVEGKTDEKMLSALETIMGRDVLSQWPIWQTSATHKERSQLFRALAEEIPGLTAVSLRDRDDEPVNTVGPDLNDLVFPGRNGFHPLKWRRRHMESYLLVPEAIARCTGLSPEDVRQQLADNFSLAIGPNFTVSECPEALMQANGKDVLCGAGSGLLAGTGQLPEDVALSMTPSEVCEDVSTFFDTLDDLNPAPPPP